MKALHIDQREFRELLKGEKPLLVDYWAPWCGYCRRIEHIYDLIAGEYGDRLVVAKVNVDENPELEDAEAIELIPTIRLYRDGKAISSIVAPGSKAAIDAFLREGLGE